MQAACGLDVTSATLFLVRASMAIHASVHECGHEMDHLKHGKQICAVSISGVIGSFAYVAEYISFAVAHCPLIENANAMCAGAISELLGALATFSAAGSSFSLTCGKQLLPGEPIGERPYRRLASNALR